MKNPIAGYLAGIPLTARPRQLLLSKPNSESGAEKDAVTIDNNKTIKKRYNSFTLGILDHAKSGSKITEAVERKLILGVKILQMGGVTKLFKQKFSATEGEKLLKVFQCYLSTTAGPIAGLLFISNNKVSFCSERSIKISSQTGDLVKIQYKVVIPLRMIKRVTQSMNVNDSSKKYIEIVTVDDFDFWFMGFLNYKKTFKYLQQAIPESHQ